MVKTQCRPWGTGKTLSETPDKVGNKDKHEGSADQLTLTMNSKQNKSKCDHSCTPNPELNRNFQCFPAEKEI